MAKVERVQDNVQQNEPTTMREEEGTPSQEVLIHIGDEWHESREAK
jgi:hypothetical protein